MPSVRIVCTHDALSTAETLARLLGAELYDVRISFGRHSLSELDEARAAREAVLLIWSYDAPGAHYMLEWALAIDAARVVEIARAQGWPRTARRAPVIDFTTWRGERGGRAWNALADRLRGVTRAFEPAKPPPHRAAMALGLVSAAAVGGALLLRINDVLDPVAPEPAFDEIAAAYDPADGVGGALSLVEPASAEDEFDFSPGPFGARPVPLAAVDSAPLAPAPVYEPVELRDATIVERLTALNPLRGDDE